VHRSITSNGALSDVENIRVKWRFAPNVLRTPRRATTGNGLGAPRPTGCFIRFPTAPRSSASAVARNDAALARRLVLARNDAALARRRPSRHVPFGASHRMDYSPAEAHPAWQEYRFHPAALRAERPGGAATKAGPLAVRQRICAALSRSKRDIWV
jgi:hypothetical protein